MSLIYTFIQHLCWRCVGVFVLDHFVSWQAFLITVCLYLLLTYPSLASVSFSDAASTINMVHSWHYKSTKICGFFTICSLFLWYILTLYSEMETHASCLDLLNLFISANFLPDTSDVSKRTLSYTHLSGTVSKLQLFFSNLSSLETVAGLKL